jgi:hypothetical protein
MNSTLHQNKNKKVLEYIIALVAWFAVLLQAYLTTGSLGNLFSYFTILTNSLVAISITCILFFPNKKPGIFFSKPSVSSAVTLYIFIVALVYNTVLRGIFVLNGLVLFVDTLLHVIVPVLYILYCFLYVPRGVLKWQDGVSWIFFPLLYLIYSLIRGEIINWYPYPFLNVSELGYIKVFINLATMVAVFFVAGLCLIGFNRGFKTKHL